MALSFGSGTTNKVNHGSAAALDTLGQGSLLMWIKPTSVANGYRGYASKATDATEVGWTFHTLGSDGTSFRLTINRATLPLTLTSTGILSAGAWQFVGVAWDVTDVIDPGAVYHGTLTNVVGDVTSAAVVGSGTQSNDAATSLVVGNVDATEAASANAVIAAFALWNRRLPANEVRQQQYGMIPTSGCQVLAHYWGTGTQPDYSGHANSGTVTGATAAAHVPLGAIFGARLDSRYAVAAAAFNPSTGFPWPTQQQPFFKRGKVLAI